MIHLTHCRLDDLSLLPSYGYAVFVACDLQAVPAEQVRFLRVYPDNPKALAFGGP